MAKKLLVTGISGFLGSHLAKKHSKDWQIIGTYAHYTTRYPDIDCMQLDMNDQAAMMELIEVIEPDAVFHFAALSNPNYCEANPEDSYAINVDATKLLATQCKDLSIPFLFTSTDLVFDGTAAPYKETDSGQPVNIYGQHKLESEKIILSIYPDAIVARLPLLYGLVPHRKNFFGHWVDQLKAGEIIHAFTDEYRTLVSADDAIDGLFLLMEESCKGIWHLGGKERISRYDFAIAMANVFGLNSANIIPALQSEVSLVADRPADISLDSSRAFNQGYDPGLIAETLKNLAGQ